MLLIKSAFLVTLIFLVPGNVQGHGYLVRPQARGLVNKYHDLMSMFCGGVYKLHTENNGRCGECGDPYDQPRARDNEYGGYRVGEIRRFVYEQGSVMHALVKLTAAHKGFFEFRICDVSEFEDHLVTQACLDQNLLRIAGTDNTRFYGDNGLMATGEYVVPLQLPPYFLGEFVTLQWRYKTGNSWGVDPVTGIGCLGCGPQEEFKNCADIAIVPPGSDKLPLHTPPPPPPATTTTTTTTTTPSPNDDDDDDDEVSDDDNNNGDVPEVDVPGEDTFNDVEFNCFCFPDEDKDKRLLYWCDSICSICDDFLSHRCPAHWHNMFIGLCDSVCDMDYMYPPYK